MRHILVSTFHRNIKIILSMYYSSALLQSASFFSAQIYQMASSIMSKPCNFFPPNYTYATFHLLGATATGVMILSLVAMCIERTVATIFSSTYESNGIVLGLCLFVLTIAAAITAVSYVYDMDSFDAKTISMVIVPPAALAKFNRVMILSMIVSFACIVTFHVSSQINKKQDLRSAASLTSRYQMRENVVTTEFATHIATMQVLFFIFYAASGLLIRVYGPKLFPNNEKMYTSLRQLSYAAPVFMVVLPIYSMRRLKYYRMNRNSNIRSIVMMESRGLAGSRNYEEAIGRAWQLDRQVKIPPLQRFMISNRLLSES
ncbi:hypothetical protein KIN20_004226 [Parelaphostrongylus tenuis]|nr:hypothetical protein KIN20_004226 [Parelaphostrongylus tenuis]